MKTEQLSKYGIVIPTREYIGGIFGGFGLGVLVTTAVLSPAHRVTEPWVWLLVCGCIVTGSLLARAAQRKRFQKGVIDAKPVA